MILPELDVVALLGTAPRSLRHAPCRISPCPSTSFQTASAAPRRRPCLLLPSRQGARRTHPRPRIFLACGSQQRNNTCNATVFSSLSLGCNAAPRCATARVPFDSCSKML
jgi:hypothetical protein